MKRLLLRRLHLLSRPFGLALAVFSLLNLLLALDNPQSSATRVWLNLGLPEPVLSIFAAFLGLALILPHDTCARPWLRWVVGGVVFGFCILVGANVIGYYHRLELGQFRTDLPLPFSAFVLVILLAEFARISWWVPVEPRLPAPAWFFVRGTLLAVAFFALIFLHIVTFGRTDYRRAADAAVILGAKVHDDGELSEALEERVDTGIDLYREGLVSFLIMSGGIGSNGLSEPECMARHARAMGVPPVKIILDAEGWTTLDSARNCGRIAREQGFSRLLTVSQDYHCARIKLIFERAGTPCFTVPAGGSRRGLLAFKPSFPLLREIFAYPFYFLRYS